MRFDLLEDIGTNVIRHPPGQCPPKGNGYLSVSLHGSVKDAWRGLCWYVVFVCEVETMPRTPYTDEAVGIDLGVSKLATLSTGDVIENPRHYRKAEKKLEKAQQAL